MTTSIKRRAAATPNLGHVRPAKVEVTPAALAARIFGIALLIASAGLWLVPGSSLAAEMVLIKIGISLFLVFGGVLMIHASMHVPEDVNANAAKTA